MTKIDSKLNLSNKYFSQSSGDTLTLSGNTIIEGRLNFGAGYAPTDDTSVVTKQYTDAIGVDNLVFTDGLSRSGNTVMLGGSTFNPIEFDVENNFTISSTNLSLTDIDNTFNEVPKDTILVNDQWSIYTTLGGSEYSTGAASYVYNVTAFDVSDAGFTTFVPSVHITKKRTDIEDEFEELYFNINGNPFGWTGTTITNSDSYLFKLASSRNFLLVHEANFASPTLNGDVLIFDLIGQTVDRVSNYIPQINNFSFPNGGSQTGSKNIFKDLNIQQINSGNDFAVSFYDRTTSILHYYNSEGTGTTILIQSGDTITGDLTSFPSINNTTFAPVLRPFVSTSNLGKILTIDVDTTDFNNKYYFFNITTGEINNYSLTSTQIDFLTSVSDDINGNQDNIYDFKQINSGRFSAVENIYTLPSKQILFGVESRVIEFGNTYETNFTTNPSRTISINGDNGSIDYSLVDVGSNKVRFSISGFEYNYNGLGNTTETETRPNAKYLPNSGGNVTGDTWFEYKRNLFTLGLTNSGFTYPSTYTSAPLDGLITRRVLLGQTINDYTSYSANTENIAGADAFNSLKTTVDNLNAETSVNDLTFQNGIVKSGNNVKLGGDITEETTLTSGFGFDVEGDNISLSDINTSFSAVTNNFGDVTNLATSATVQSFNNNYQLLYSIDGKAKIYNKQIDELDEFDFNSNIIPSGWTISGDTGFNFNFNINSMSTDYIRVSYNTFLIVLEDSSGFPLTANYVLLDAEKKVLTIYNENVSFSGGSSMNPLESFGVLSHALYSKSGLTYLLISGLDANTFDSVSYIINQSANTLTEITTPIIGYVEQYFIGRGSNPNALTSIEQTDKFVYFNSDSLYEIDLSNNLITLIYTIAGDNINVNKPFYYLELPDIGSIISATLVQDDNIKGFRRFIYQTGDSPSETNSFFPTDAFDLKKHIYTDTTLKLGIYGFTTEGLPRELRKLNMNGTFAGSLTTNNIYFDNYSVLAGQTFIPDLLYISSINTDGFVAFGGNSTFNINLTQQGFQYPTGYTPTEPTSLITLDYFTGNTSSGGTSSKNVQDIIVVSANTTLVNTNYNALVDTSANTITVTLPSTPIDGQVHEVKDYAGGASINNIIINGNTKTIDNSATVVISSNYSIVKVIYSQVLDSWFIK